MRKLVVCNLMSLDGYVAGPGEDVMVLPLDASFDAYNAERLRAADTLLLGRRSYEGFRSFWPGWPRTTASRPTSGRSLGWTTPSTKVVVSDSLTPDDTNRGATTPGSSAAPTRTGRSPS